MPLEWLNKTTLGLLPAEVQDKHTGATVERTVLRQLPGALKNQGEGDWLVTLNLPSGYRISKEVHTDSQGELDVQTLVSELMPAGAERFPPIATLARSSNIRDFMKDVDWKAFGTNIAALALEKFAGRHALLAETAGFGRANAVRYPLAKLVFFKGSVFDRAIEQLKPDQVSIARGANDSAEISGPSEGVLIVQIKRADQATLNVVLPPGCRLSLSINSDQPSPGVSISVAFGHPLVDAAVNLRSGANIAELLTIAGNLSEGDIETINSLSAGAAVCLAYLLLRAQSKLLTLAITRLPPAVMHLSDAWVIQGEAAALRGQHGDALKHFLAAVSRGLPMFGQGLTYLTDRLRVYEKTIDPEDTHFSTSEAGALGSSDLKSIEAVLERLEQFSLNCDYSAPTTTYFGVEPADPGPSRLSKTAFIEDEGFPINL